MEQSFKKKDTLNKIITVLAIAYGIYHWVSSKYMLMTSDLHVNMHIMVGVGLVLLMNVKLENNKFSLRDIIHIILAGLLVVTMLYVHFNYVKFKTALGIYPDDMVIAGAIIIGICLYVTKRQWGWLMPIFAAIALLYGHYGPYIPAPFFHGGIKWSRLICSVSTTFDGLYGTLTITSANTIALFCIFAGMLEAFGMMEAIISMCGDIGDRFRGGDAQFAVISAGIIGSITGSAAANVSMTGAISMPMMNRRGYSREFGAGVSAAASTGGSILPPVMNAAAFIISAWIGVSYIHLVAIGVTPALLYYLGISLAVYIVSCKIGIKKGRHINKKKKTLKDNLMNAVFLIPIMMLIVFLIVGYSAQMALFYALASVVVVGFIREGVSGKQDSIVDKLKNIGNDILKGLNGGARSAATLVPVLATMGIVVWVLQGTGLSSKFSQWALDVAGSQLFLLCVMVAVVCIIFGMGMPSAPAYIMTALLGAPALVGFGIPVLCAHFFVFYFAEMSALTPPVALCALVASGMNKCSFFKTCLRGMEVGIMGFVIPFFFIYKPEILFTGTFGEYLWALILALLFLVDFVPVCENYLFDHLKIWERIGFAVAAVCILIQYDLMDYIGVGLSVALLIIHFIRSKDVREARKNEDIEVFTDEIGELKKPATDAV